MFKQILKIIWKERRPNTWLFLELMVGFTVLWFCADYLYFITKRINEPLGKDISNVYQVRVGVKPEAFLDYDDEKAEQMLEDFWMIYDRIKSYPAVEVVSASRNRGLGDSFFYVDSVARTDSKDRPKPMSVTPEYFEVFKLNLTYGRFFNEDDYLDKTNVIISGNYNNTFIGKEPHSVEQVLGQESGMQTDEANEYDVVGVVEKNKDKSYNFYPSNIYHPLPKNDKSLLGRVIIHIRVNPNAGADFPDKFVNDMYEQISIEPFYLAGLTDVETIQEDNLKTVKEVNQRNSMLAISFFLMINVFLGVMGTFWLKIGINRKNIGLRRAVGASQFSIKSMFFQEAMILLFIAACAGFIICFHIVLLDVLTSLGVPQARNIFSRYYEPMPTIQYWINNGLTLLFLFIIICISVWYPAKKASDIPPVEALRSE